LVSQEEIQVLMKLGLTFNQSRVFLALDQQKKFTVKEISKISNVARETVYRIIPELQNLGLVEKEIAAPCKFLSIDFDAAITSLLNLRQQETNIILAKTQELLKNKKDLKKYQFLENESHITLLPSNDLVLRKIYEAIIALKKSYFIISPLKRHNRAILEFGKILNDALLRGVIIKNVLEKSENNDIIPKHVLEFHLQPRAKIRTYVTSSQTTVLIFDEKEVFILLGAPSEFAGAPALMTNNEILVTLAIEYFETLWTNCSSSKI